MNLRFIEAFVWVARLRSFTAAAERLHTTQAAVSARIATLEGDFGVRLFERGPRSVALTPAGEELLRHAEPLLGASARMLDAVSQRAIGASGAIAIGVIDAVIHTWLPDMLCSLRREHQQSRVEIHSYTSFDLLDELLKGQLDLVFTSEHLSSPEIVNTEVCRFPMAWVAAPAVASSRPGRDLLNETPILAFLRNSFVYRNVLETLGTYAATRINPVSSIAAIVALTRTGYGVAALPVPAIRAPLANGELCVLTDVPALSPIPIVATRRASSDSLLVEVVVRIAETIAQESAADTQ